VHLLPNRESGLVSRRRMCVQSELVDGRVLALSLGRFRDLTRYFRRGTLKK